MKRFLIIGMFLASGSALADMQVKVLQPTSLEILGFGEVTNNKFVMRLVDDYSGLAEVLVVYTEDKDFEQFKGNIDHGVLWISFPNGPTNLKTFVLNQGWEFKQVLVPKQSLRK
ncbi:MAG: hypothetical protein U0Z75_02485 [Deinococcaceae bacterium]